MIVILLIYLMHDEMIMIMRGNWNWEKREKTTQSEQSKGKLHYGLQWRDDYAMIKWQMVIIINKLTYGLLKTPPNLCGSERVPLRQWRRSSNAPANFKDRKGYAGVLEDKCWKWKYARWLHESRWKWDEVVNRLY